MKVIFLSAYGSRKVPTLCHKVRFLPGLNQVMNAEYINR